MRLKNKHALNTAYTVLRMNMPNLPIGNGRCKLSTDWHLKIPQTEISKYLQPLVNSSATSRGKEHPVTCHKTWMWVLRLIRCKEQQQDWIHKFWYLNRLGSLWRTAKPLQSQELSSARFSVVRRGHMYHKCSNIHFQYVSISKIWVFVDLSVCSDWNQLVVTSAAGPCHSLNLL